MSPVVARSRPTALAATRPRRASGGTSWGQVRLLPYGIPGCGPSNKADIGGYYSLAEDVPPKDKHYRKYASGIERALSLFDTALQEWADYISFLNRLLKVRASTLVRMPGNIV